MKKRITARAIIFDKDNIILMKRKRKTDYGILEYFSTVGGLQEDGETIEETLLREVKEETNLDVKITKKLGYIEKEDFKSYYFLCEIIGGEMTLGGEEAFYNNQDNYYELVVVPFNEVEGLNIFGKEKVLEGIKYLYD